MAKTPHRQATLAYVAPFAVYVVLLFLDHSFAWPVKWWYPIRFAASAAALAWAWPRVAIGRPSAFWASLAVGAAVFAIWIAPDVLFGPAYRRHWIFSNSLMGGAAGSTPDALRHSPAFIILRAAGSAALVPPLEELFWRGWMMRWLIHHDFQDIPLGTYAPLAFWGVAVMFASEHGAYWEVGLAAGIIYNWWMLRTKNLADCILAHAATNAFLSAYILLAGQWQYWP